MTDFEMLGMAPAMLEAVLSQGFTAPTDIQKAAIPTLLDGKDLLGVAETGGGKTAAFLVPIIEDTLNLGERPTPHRPRGLILAPTRELAGQIGTELRRLTRGQKVYHTVISGGQPFRAQFSALEKGVHILIATPGRLLDHMRRGTVTLDSVQMFTLDECDRMLDMGFLEDVRQFKKSLPANHQTIMFSATMSREIQNLANQLLNDHELVEVSKRNSVAESIDHKVLMVDYTNKQAALDHILENGSVSKMLVFSRTKAMADDLADTLKDKGYKSDALHGDIRQHIRDKVLRRFRSGQVEILVATDVAARGIDVPDISHVVNYDVPLEADSYVHRAGRTGRAGATGIAYTICTKNDVGLLCAIERMIEMPIPVDREQPYHKELNTSRPGGGKGFKRGGRRNDFGGRGRPDSGSKWNGKPRSKPWQKDGGSSEEKRSFGGRNSKPWQKDGGSSEEKRSSGGRNSKPWQKDGGSSEEKRSSGGRNSKPWQKDGGSSEEKRSSGGRNSKPWQKDGGSSEEKRSVGAKGKSWIKDGGLSGEKKTSPGKSSKHKGKGQAFSKIKTKEEKSGNKYSEKTRLRRKKAA